MRKGSHRLNLLHRHGARGNVHFAAVAELVVFAVPDELGPHFGKRVGVGGSPVELVSIVVRRHIAPIVLEHPWAVFEHLFKGALGFVLPGGNRASISPQYSQRGRDFSFSRLETQAHRQPLRDPFQAQGGFPAQPPSQLHLLLIALAPPWPFLFVPAQTLEFLSHDHFAILGLLPAPTAGFSDVTSLYVAKYGVPPVDSCVVIRTRQQVNGCEDRPKETAAVVPPA